MKKINLLFLTIIAIQVFFVLPIFAQSQENTVRVGVYDNHPKIYQNENGEICGFCADIIDYIAEAEKWDIQYVHGTWAEGLERLEKNDIDIMVDVALSKEREKIYDFNQETILVNWAAAYATPGVEINSIFDLEGKKVAVMKRGIHYCGPYGLKFLTDSFNIKIEVIDVDVYADVFESLDKNNADVGIVNRIFGISNQNKYDIVRTNLIFNPIELKFALKKDNTDNILLINTLDYHLVKLKGDPNSIYYESITTHLKGVVEKVEIIPNWINATIFVITLLLLLAIIIIFLSKQYQHRLKEKIEKTSIEIKESEKKYKGFFKSSSDAIMILNKNLFIDCNKATLKMFEMKSINNFKKKHPADLSPKKQPDGQNSMELANKQIAKALEKGSNHFEWMHRRNDGTDFYADVMLTKITLKDGPIIWATVRDITKQKLREQKFQELDDLKNKFIQIMSHQLRTPLGLIRWNLEEILSESIGSLSKEQKIILELAYKYNLNIIGELNNSITVLDIKKGKLLIIKKPAKIEKLCESVLSEFKKACNLKNITYKYKTPDEPIPEIRADSAKIRNIFTQLIKNAIDYTKDGGKINLSIVLKNNKIRFEIADTGIGIPKAEQSYIFTQFFRASNASKMAPNRSGIGLFIAKYFVQQHNGIIGFESTEGKGSKFWFEIPAIQENKK